MRRMCGSTNGVRIESIWIDFSAPTDYFPPAMTTNQPSTIPIRRALISVSRKEGLDHLAQILIDRGIELLSSGGTAKYLQERKIPVTEISDYTKAPEMLDGRLKTLHPKIHGGLLAVRDNPSHMSQMDREGYAPIDLVVVNLYPFEKTSRNEKASFSDVIEQIDIGGPTLLRAAAKNFPFVAVLVGPQQYGEFLEEFDKHDGGTSYDYRQGLAQRVFERTALYDAAIANYFQNSDSHLPQFYALGLERKWELRYGENPHQQGGFYLPAAAEGETCLEKVLQGKRLSHNNLMDAHAALELIREFDGSLAVAILKHANPCGVGISDNSLSEAYGRALACDPTSAFGGIVTFSATVDEAAARSCVETFTEIVIAPQFTPEALAVFQTKKNLRVLEVPDHKLPRAFEMRRCADGYLIQQPDQSSEDLTQAEVVTKRHPIAEEMEALLLAWKVVKPVKSNAIVIANRE